MGILIQGVIRIGREPRRIMVMLIGGLLMYLGIKKKYEPTLLVPMGLGTVLVNFPNSGVLSANDEPGPFNIFSDFGIKTELFPSLLSIGIRAMIDFGPSLQNPFMLMFGAATQLEIFSTVIMATLLGLDLNDAVSIGVIDAADSPTFIFIANTLYSKYMGAIMVAAYSYVTLVPTIQPVAVRAVTTETECRIRMTYRADEVSQTAKILFPVVITIVAGLIALVSLPLAGFLIFGGLLRECGALSRPSIMTQNELVNIISILLGLFIPVSMNYVEFLKVDTLMVIGLGLVAPIMDSIGDVPFAKFLDLFREKKINPTTGAAGISAFPMSSRVTQKMATGEDPRNFVLMHVTGANTLGQVASVITGGLLLAFLTQDGGGNKHMFVNIEDLKIAFELLGFSWGDVFVVLFTTYLASKLLAKLFPVKKQGRLLL